MLSMIRRRFTYTNIVLTIALLFAMSGGAYAASRYAITSTKQISPKVLTALKGKAGAAGKNGTNGTNGAAGSQGPAGAKGEPGSQGPEGKEGKEGKEGQAGTNGTTGFTETLPAGKTETGTWAFKEEGIAALSFSIPLEAPISSPSVHYVTSAQASGHEVSQCSGSVGAPTAEAGNLCIYEGLLLNATQAFVFAGTSSTQGAATSGAVVTFTDNAANALGMGTWAVTAPSE